MISKAILSPFSLDRVRAYLSMIRFSHTVFALPFALTAFVLAVREKDVGFFTLFWIIIAMISARSAAMGFNRIADAGTDAENPRTSIREIPAGKIDMFSAVRFVLLFSGIFIFAAYMLGGLCFQLSLPVLIVLFAYSYTKRFTCLSHVFLGFAISLAPLAAWVAATGEFSFRILPLCFGLLFYIAGFDILYSRQDMDFDRNAGLKSMPVRFGAEKAFQISRAFHFASFLFFLMLSPIFSLSAVYLVAVMIIGILYIFEHLLVSPDDLSNINIAFFHINSFISVVLFFGVFLDILIY